MTFAAERTLTLSVTGVATTDYSLEPTTLTLAAGDGTATATFTALADDEDEETEDARIGVVLDGAEVASATVAIRASSSDATLSALALTDADIGEFDAETTAYAAGRTLGSERTSQLSTGANEIAATVTAEDGAAERTYAVTVTRQPAWGSRLPARDIALAGDGEASALWSDGAALWASSILGGAAAYRLSDGARLESEDLDGMLAAAGNDAPSGLW